MRTADLANAAWWTGAAPDRPPRFRQATRAAGHRSAQSRSTGVRTGVRSGAAQRRGQAITHTLRTVSMVRQVPTYPGFMMKQSPGP